MLFTATATLMDIPLLLLQNDPSQCRSILRNHLLYLEVWEYKRLWAVYKSLFWHLEWNMAHNECVRAVL